MIKGDKEEISNAINELLTRSLVGNEKEIKEKLSNRLGIEKDDDGKYLKPFISMVALKRKVSYDTAKDIIANSRDLSRLLFILA